MHFSSGPHKITIKSNVTKTDQNWQALPRGRNCQLDSSKLQNWVVGPDPARTSLTRPSLQTHSQKWQVCAPPTRTTQLNFPDWTSQLGLNFINPHKPFKSHFWGFFLKGTFCSIFPAISETNNDLSLHIVTVFTFITLADLVKQPRHTNNNFTVGFFLSHYIHWRFVNAYGEDYRGIINRASMLLIRVNYVIFIILFICQVFVRSTLEYCQKYSQLQT